MSCASVVFFVVFSVSISETNIKTQTEYQVLMPQIFLKAVLYFVVQKKVS